MFGEKNGRLTIQCDQMWSFVSNKGNKQSKQLGLDVKTGEIVGVNVCGRSRQRAKRLWQSLPGLYRQCAVCYTDFWSASEQVIPKSRHPCRR